jgi:hypothetical protein
MPCNELDNLVEVAADAADEVAVDQAGPPAAEPEDAHSLLNNSNGTATIGASNVARRNTSNGIVPPSHQLLPWGGRVATSCS